ncbi:unnamed protein product [Paramecium pentaurelia]|uniref:F-box domain-containing protein n=1 Tax=Paramecium pentaurelia TaxID=43138 RepID=A0A8S1Y8D6_9CILI|nr:unnamed protein product [Paramecium pentaurelia]
MLLEIPFHILDLILSCLTYQELKRIQWIDQFFATYIPSIILRTKNQISISIFDSNKSLGLNKWLKLDKLHLIISTTSLQELKQILRQIPQSVKKLKIQLNYDLIIQERFYSYISKYSQQLITLKLIATGPNIIQTKQNIDSKFLHNHFYEKMRNLKTFQLDTTNLSKITNESIQNYLFFALFYKDEQFQRQPTIQKISFDQLADTNQMERGYLQQSNFQINTTIKKITLKQFDQAQQMNLLIHLQKLTILIGDQVESIKLCQHLNLHTIIEGDKMTAFLKHFNNLRVLSLNIYNISFEISNFELDELAQLNLRSLGLASLKYHQSHFASLFSLLPNLIMLNLDFTSIDDECLNILGYLTNYTQLKIRGCRKLTNGSLLPFLEKQKYLTQVDIRGVLGFSKKAFRLLTKNNILQQLCISDNKINNSVLVDLLNKNSGNLRHLNIGELMNNQGLTNDVFKQAKERNICLLNMQSASVKFTAQSFSIKVVSDFLYLVPNIQVLCLKINFQNIMFLIDQILEHESICNSLQKLTLSCNCFAHLNVSQREILIFQSFRQKAIRLDTLTLNVSDGGNEVGKIFFNCISKKTQGHDIRLVLPQQNIQYII